VEGGLEAPARVATSSPERKAEAPWPRRRPERRRGRRKKTASLPFSGLQTGQIPSLSVRHRCIWRSFGEGKSRPIEVSSQNRPPPRSFGGPLVALPLVSVPPARPSLLFPHPLGRWHLSPTSLLGRPLAAERSGGWAPASAKQSRVVLVRTPAGHSSGASRGVDFQNLPPDYFLARFDLIWWVPGVEAEPIGHVITIAAVLVSDVDVCISFRDVFGATLGTGWGLGGQEADVEG
jgi:hypothetical protein